MKKLRKALGFTILSWPLVVLFILVVRGFGILASLAVVGTAAAILLITFTGIWLLEEN